MVLSFALPSIKEPAPRVLVEVHPLVLAEEEQPGQHRPREPSPLDGGTYRIPNTQVVTVNLCVGIAIASVTPYVILIALRSVRIGANVSGATRVKSWGR